ncbi:MAG: hypothetical protein CVV27_18345 [Candidatus Melainabacteria bacterium HGW-Melainabacteria-1]|nr:MAG: hypothetical protein CVV27_18345 [Candidatus Melainabacteria bacterium HGW-Melainabacteria-1]
MNQDLETQAAHFDAIATELEQALSHARIAARHLRDGEVPRGCAHAFALEGHLLQARQSLDAAARLHARKARPTPMGGQLV